MQNIILNLIPGEIYQINAKECYFADLWLFNIVNCNLNTVLHKLTQNNINSCSSYSYITQFSHLKKYFTTDYISLKAGVPFVFVNSAHAPPKNYSCKNDFSTCIKKCSYNYMFYVSSPEKKGYIIFNLQHMKDMAYNTFLYNAYDNTNDDDVLNLNLNANEILEKIKNMFVKL